MQRKRYLVLELTLNTTCSHSTSGGQPAARTTKLDHYDLNPILAGTTELRQM